MFITWQSLITAGAVITALGGIIAWIAKTVRWFDRQKKQDEELKALREKHDKEVEQLRSEESKHIHEIKEEQTLLTYGILACLKGLQEKGCNGPVTEAIGKIEKHLNLKAHE